MASFIVVCVNVFLTIRLKGEDFLLSPTEYDFYFEETGVVVGEQGEKYFVSSSSSFSYVSLSLYNMVSLSSKSE